MERYLVESNHSPGNCEMVIKETHSLGYLHYFEWGCADDVHTGWAFIEAEDREQALMSVPSIVRNQARAVRVVQFGREDATKHHQS
ncbi:MAG: hypothetical protein PVI81_00200 [Anaerolineales bacterium]